MTENDIMDETAVETTDTSLTIRRTFDAPRERVYRSFTVPDELEAWQSIGELAVTVHTLEPELDGALSVSHFHGDERIDIEGTFLEVVENERLVHSWRMVDGPYGDSETRITVEFRDVEAGTEVAFTHDEIDPEVFDSAMIEGTAGGWRGMLDNLATVLRDA